MGEKCIVSKNKQVFLRPQEHKILALRYHNLQSLRREEESCIAYCKREEFRKYWYYGVNGGFIWNEAVFVILLLLYSITLIQYDDEVRGRTMTFSM